MKKTRKLIEFIIVLVISILISIPRAFRFEDFNIWNFLSQFSYIFILNGIYWIYAGFVIRLNKPLIISLLIFLPVTSFFSIFYHLLTNNFIFHFTLLSDEFPLFEELNLKIELVILFVRGFLFSGIIYLIYFYLKLLTETQENALEIEKLKKEKLEAQLSLLKQQISPHFLFNSLSTLRTMVTEETSKKYINNLANVYRYLLNLNENDLVSLKDELAFTDSYLSILQERYEEALQIQNLIPTDVQHKKIPPLALQLLIENAIKHNEISVKNPLHIKLELIDERQIVISNNVQPKLSKDESTGKGLNNIRLRYKILADETIKVERSEEVFKVSIPVF